MLPIELEWDSKHTSSMCPIIALTSPGGSTNNILINVVSDVLNALTVRIKIVHLFAIEIRIFIDVSGFVAD